VIANRSVSSRLTIWFSSVFFAGLILFGAVMWLDLEDTLLTGRAKTLDKRADRLSDLLRDTQREPPESRAKKFQAFAEATGGGLIQVFHTDGSHAFPSPSPAAEAFPWPKLAVGERERLQEVTLRGQPYLVLARPFSLGTQPLVLCVAATLEGNLPILRTFSAGLLWTIPGLLALSALGGYVLSRRALKPVDQITAATRLISVSNLSERLPVPQTRDELQRLSETCNGMLARLESAVKEIQRFTADASHELRSPLSFIRTVAEVALRNRQADPASKRAFEEIVEECGKAGRLLEDMLTLARADAGNAHLVYEPVDLAELVTAVCDKASLLLSRRQHTLTVSPENAFHTAVWGDYSSLRRLLWILLENAIKYTPSPGSISVTVSATLEKAIVTVKDNGIGISATDLPHIFERFYRADTSRSQVEGSGLGLAMAKWIADVHKAGLSVESTENIGSVFQVVFPVLAEAQVRSTAQGLLRRDAIWPVDSAIADGDERGAA
jgi:heavy metal sensor kinase